MKDKIETRTISYPDLQTEEFQKVNPLKKVPALVRPDGETVFESFVILEYLEDKYGDQGVSFKPSTPEGRQKMNLLIRVHDLYIASPNCTQPGFAHTQGCMYLAPVVTKFCAKERVMKRDVRAAKLAEIWKQLNWLEGNISPDENGMVDGQLTLADLTWFPTLVFMDYMLPRVFSWPDILKDPTHFPQLCSWYNARRRNTVFGSVYTTIWEHWVKSDA